MRRYWINVGIAAVRLLLPSLSQEAKPFADGQEVFNLRGPIQEAGTYYLCHQ